jgi:dCTP deaminase
MTGGILTDLAIRAAVDAGDIVIDPFDPEQLNPASYDLRLGTEVVVYDAAAIKDAVGHFDPKRELPVLRFPIDGNGIVFKPGIGYLLHTAERIATMKYVAVLDGKSSLGRLFVQVHATAGYADPGWDGQLTLELTTMYPIRLYAGMRIAQIRFHTMHGEVGKLYSGNYTGETSRGAVASRAWKQFEKDGSR